MKKLFKIAGSFGLFLCCMSLNAQNVIISDNGSAAPDPSAMLDVQATDKGMLIPRMSSAVRTAITSPAIGLLVYDLTTQSFWFYSASGWANLDGVKTDNSTLSGDGTAANPIGLAQNSASDGQVLSWNGTVWAPSTGLWLPNGLNKMYTPDRFVGIRTTDPEKPLHVKGDIVAEEMNSADGGYVMRDSNGFSRVYFNHQYFPDRTDLRLEVYVPDTTGEAFVKYFRQTNALTKRVEFYRGKGFGTERSAVIGVGGENSFFQFSGGNLGIGTDTPDEKLHVAGGIHVEAGVYIEEDLTVDGGFNQSSDARYKEKLEPLQNALNKILTIKGLNYHWKTDAFPDKHFSKEQQLGVIAQDVAKVYPELVSEDKNGYFSVDYGRFSPILIEAIREQQQIIETQQKQLDQLTGKMTALEALVNSALQTANSSKNTTEPGILKKEK